MTVGNIGDFHNYSNPQTPNHLDGVETAQAKGKLTIAVVEAKNLFSRNQQGRYYCVVEFEKNEFVTREATSHDVSPIWRHEATFDVFSEDSHFFVSIWDRGPLQETFLGFVRIMPPRSPGKYYDAWFNLCQRQADEPVSGFIRLRFIYNVSSSKPLSISDFELLKVVGKGSFGKVIQVRKRDTGRIFAMKILNKKHIIARQEVEHTLSERKVLIQANSPFLVNLKFSFQTPEKLYLGLDYMNGGELFYHLQKVKIFPEERVRFYAAELVLALYELHKCNIIYRDLKPENILLDSNGHIALTDFGLCKYNLSNNDTTNTFCGTAEYLAPEILTGNGYNKAVDWWSLGTLLYEMLAGLPPFYSEDVNVMYNKILQGTLVFPQHFSTSVIDLLTGLLQRDPRKRLGSGHEDAFVIIRHPFFFGIDWIKLSKKQITPPFKPKVESEMDTSNFDPTFTETMVPVDSLPNSNTPLSQTMQNKFCGFSYNGETGSFTYTDRGAF